MIIRKIKNIKQLPNIYEHYEWFSHLETQTHSTIFSSQDSSLCLNCRLLNYDTPNGAAERAICLQNRVHIIVLNYGSPYSQNQHIAIRIEETLEC